MKNEYRVVKKEVQAYIDGKECDFKVNRYYSTYMGRDPNDSVLKEPFVEVWADGSIVLHNGEDSIFLYDSQWIGIIDCISAALEVKKQKRIREENEWLSSTEDSKKFHGVDVSLSRRETKDALLSCGIEVENISERTTGGVASNRTEPRITYNGIEYRLGRTDLLDGVATGLCANKTAEEWRDYYFQRTKRCMGARISGDGFYIIDSLTDG